MKRFYLFAIMALAAGSVTLSARQLTPAEALGAVEAAKGAPLKARGIANNVNVTPQLTLGEDGMNTVYVFSTTGSDGGEGFLVVAADDVATPLLGYSDGSRFDAANIPPQLRWWLSQYSGEIAAAIADGDTAAAAARRSSDGRHAVEPLTHTLWNQDAPFNNLCPEVTSSAGTTARAVTGCVATAMAQVMKVHEWPAQGTGSNSYTFNYGGNSYTASMDFGATSFSWTNMVNDYTATTTESQNNAVATLMKACGVSVDMDYGLAATGGSGASAFNAAVALVKYFGYDKGLTYHSRDFYTYDEWVDMVYNEIAAGRPVLYGGQSSEGGHEFVCDGYSSESYFHFNWGWGGMSNGYFLLSALDPESQGIGGSDSGYNMSQAIVVGIQPPVEGSSVVPQMAFQGDFEPQQQSYYVGESIAFGGNGSTLFYSLSVEPVSVTIGVKAVVPGSNPVYIASGSSSTSLPPQEGWEGMEIDSSQLPVGSMAIYPAFYANGEWHDVLTSINDPGYVNATNDGNNINFSAPSTEATIEITSCQQNSEIYIGQPVQFTVIVEASGNFYGEVLPVLTLNGGIYALGTPKGLSYAPGDTDTIDWVMEFTVPQNGDPNSGTFSSGEYNLVFIAPDGTAYSDPYPVEVNEAQTVEPEVSVSSVVFAGSGSGNGRSTSPYYINPADLDVTFTLEGVQGYWSDNISGMFFEPTTGREVTSFGGAFVGIGEGETTQVKLTGSVTGLDSDVTYLFLPWGSVNKQFTDDFTYVRIPTTGIESVDADNTSSLKILSGAKEAVISGVDGVATLTVYTMTGATAFQATVNNDCTVSLSPLASGNYVFTLSGAGLPVSIHAAVK